ncbi:hypothetical protein MKX01_018275 [Papaver californicum]|nr:hypothetical protein MKX01_018275 [Papaver californicum]
MKSWLMGKDDFEDWYNAVGRFSKGESSESENGSDTFPTAQDQSAMHVDDASAVAETLANITNQSFSCGD